ncbi:hypothetical protein MRX96_033288 [Rhipicephalus microplus]
MGLMMSLERELSQTEAGRAIPPDHHLPRRAVLWFLQHGTALPECMVSPESFPRWMPRWRPVLLVSRVLRDQELIILPESFNLIIKLSLPDFCLVFFPHSVGKIVQEYLDYMVNPMTDGGTVF